MRCGVLALTLGLLVTPLLQAAPLEAKHVAGNAKWVVHVDVDAMRESLVVRNAYHGLVELHPLGKLAEGILDRSREIVGMDPRKDLKSITAYGARVGRPEGVLLVVADLDIKALQQAIKIAPDYHTTTYGSYELHAWTQLVPRATKTVVAAYRAPDTLVIADSPKAVEAALDVLDGKATRLAGDSPLAAAPEAGTTVLLRAIGIGAEPLPGDPPFGKALDTLGITMGENAGASFFHGKLTVKSTEVAGHIQQILLGVRALGLLNARDPDDKRLAEQFVVKNDGSSVTADFQAPADAVWSHIEKDAKRLIEEIKKHLKAHHGPPAK